MRESRGSWWWAQITRVLVYLALGVVSGGIALWVSSAWLPFAEPIRVRNVVLVLTWILGALLIDVRVKSVPVSEEEVPEK